MTRFPSTCSPIDRSAVRRPPVVVVVDLDVDLDLDLDVVVVASSVAGGSAVPVDPSVESVGASVDPTVIGTLPPMLTVAGGGGDAASLAVHAVRASALSARSV